MLQSSIVLNFRALRQRTPAIQPIMYRCHELSLQRIEPFSDWLTMLYLAVFRLFTDLITNSTRFQTQIVTPVSRFEFTDGLSLK